MIRLENVSLRYQQGADVLRHINLDIPQGAFRFLTGPSGAGKTSLLKLIFLAHAPSSGRICSNVKPPAPKVWSQATLKTVFFRRCA